MENSSCQEFGMSTMGHTRQFWGQCISSIGYCDDEYMTLPQSIALYMNGITNVWHRLIEEEVGEKAK